MRNKKIFERQQQNVEDGIRGARIEMLEYRDVEARKRALEGLP